MKLLLDTDVLLWAATEPDRLGEVAREAIEDGTHDVRVSSVTAWEIAIKQSLGKLDLDRPAEIWLPDVIRRTGLEAASIELGAALRVRALPWHHRDPFDRLLVAHALEDGYTVVTRDRISSNTAWPCSPPDPRQAAAPALRSSSSTNPCGSTDSAPRTPPGPEGSNGSGKRVW